MDWVPSGARSQRPFSDLSAITWFWPLPPEYHAPTARTWVRALNMICGLIKLQMSLLHYGLLCLFPCSAVRAHGWNDWRSRFPHRLLVRGTSSCRCNFSAPPFFLVVNIWHHGPCSRPLGTFRTEGRHALPSMKNVKRRRALQVTKKPPSTIATV